MPITCFPIRIDEKMLDKLHVVAHYEERTANSQVLSLIRESIKHYETQNGAIPLQDFGEIYEGRKNTKSK